MARLPRVVVVDLPHHVTQRGNARQTVFVHDAMVEVQAESMVGETILHREVIAA